MRKPRRPWLWATLAMATLALAATGGYIPASPFLYASGWALAERGAALEDNVAYGGHPRQLLDIYRPSSEIHRKRTIVVFLYGGGWRSGNRGYYRFVGSAFASRGFTTVIPDYRVFPEVRFPAFVEDTAKAYAWVTNNLMPEESVDRIVLIGHSAGAHSVALLALDRSYLSAAGVTDARPAGWVGLAGPYAFEPTTWPSTKDIFKTATDPDEPRPVTHVDTDAPPALLFHGTRDDVVKPWNAERMVAAYRAANRPVVHREIKGYSHLGVLLAMAWPFRGTANIFEEILAFLEHNNRNSAGSTRPL